MPSGAGDDLAQTLVGRWDGQVGKHKRGAAGVQDRILVIRSVTQQEGKWTLAAAYGTKGRGLSPVVDASVEKAGGEIALKFKVPEGADGQMHPMELTLFKDGKHLIGAIYVFAGARGGNTREAKFEKAEAAQ